ncbi:MAG: response regulator transcription factor [Deltaproteobacteria bacterium]|nr:response regulator transcription factor [Deltaproteobacteria bacterium]
MKTTILIIDDHPLFREGLKAILRQEDMYEVIGEAGNGHEGLSMVRQMKPDFVLMDISLPDQNGIELTREIRTLSPGTRVLIVSMHNKVETIAEAFQAGATGYIVKESTTKRLLDGLKYILEGKYFLDSSVSQVVVKKLMESPVKEKNITDAGYGRLTLREQEVMCLLAEGVSIKKIAERLFISPKTVENHRASIMSKLGLHNGYELIRYAVKLGIIDVDIWKG